MSCASSGRIGASASFSSFFASSGIVGEREIQELRKDSRNCAIRTWSGSLCESDNAASESIHSRAWPSVEHLSHQIPCIDPARVSAIQARAPDEHGHIALPGGLAVDAGCFIRPVGQVDWTASRPERSLTTCEDEGAGRDSGLSRR